MNTSLGMSVVVWECQKLPLGGGGTQTPECENEREPLFLISESQIKFTSS